MKKYIFTWYVTDGFTYGYDCIIPFECDDITKFIYDAITKVEASQWGAEILGIRINKDESSGIEHAVMTLEEWFERDLKPITMV